MWIIRRFLLIFENTSREEFLTCRYQVNHGQGLLQDRIFNEFQGKRGCRMDFQQSKDVGHDILLQVLGTCQLFHVHTLVESYQKQLFLGCDIFLNLSWESVQVIE
jgi:hypothetical protein